MKLTTLQKIDKLSEACKGSLSFVHHFHGWKINSYEDETPLNIKFIYPCITDKTFKGVVDKAYDYVFKSSKK